MDTNVIDINVHSERSRSGPSKAKDRLYEIDFVKALAILTVVFIHCNTSGIFSSQTPIEAFLSDWSSFAVPTFLFAAGFLFNKDQSVGSFALGRRMIVRIIPPYLFCSLLWIAYRLIKGKLAFDWYEIVELLAIGEAHGVYYFVFVISYLYAFGLALRSLPAHFIKWIWGLSVIAMACYFLLWPYLVFPDLSLQSIFRSPVVHTLPFLTGWLVSLHYTAIRSFLAQIQTRYVVLMLSADFLALILLQYIDIQIRSRNFLVQTHIYLWLASIMILSLKMRWNSRWITYLSLSSYGIYLTHVVFVDKAQKIFNGIGHSDFPLHIILSCILVTVVTLLFLELVKRSTGRYAELLVGVKA